MTVTRRAILAAAPAATVSAISPALGCVYRSAPDDVDVQLAELAAQFIADAKAIDPTIKGGWRGLDMTMKGRSPSGALQMVYFERDHAPFVRPRKPATT